MVEQVLAPEPVVALELLDRRLDVAARRQINCSGQLGVVAAKRGAAGKHGQQHSGCRETDEEKSGGAGVHGEFLLATTPQPRLS